MIKIIIVDDEVKSAELLQLKLRKFCPAVEVLQVFTEPEKALLYLEDNSPDAAFLDIEMPGMSGLALANKIKDKTEIIFVTAYEKYSLEAFRIAALDYLLKPIDEKYLVSCVNRLEEKLKFKTSNVPVKKLNTQFDKIAVPSSEGVHFINVNDIIRVEAESNYSVFYFADKKRLTVSKTLKQVEEVLSSYTFFRPHKSYIINLGYIKTYIRGMGGTIVLTDGSEVELSREKKSAFLQMFEKL